MRDVESCRAVRARLLLGRHGALLMCEREREICCFCVAHVSIYSPDYTELGLRAHSVEAKKENRHPRGGMRVSAGDAPSFLFLLTPARAAVDPEVFLLSELSAAAFARQLSGGAGQPQAKKMPPSCTTPAPTASASRPPLSVVCVKSERLTVICLGLAACQPSAEAGAGLRQGQKPWAQPRAIFFC